ncbi:SigE family RNA polymerase sigma factor [Yinghuangia seranimata]|uniref:SigE family RNA polymerase sigma factor n=1 Tax=Yinghuangia seranimata TaxID=408067 RepID=UPI00248BE9CB|nr:SigE family RNA polymerase sigma factor [Yinghuangia seranimata]MDI2128067.1 SigE family RNA polymerase sigma factor [Yinghuangia seranimata]
MAGHDDALREFIIARRGPLLRSAFLLCGDVHEAEDLVQSTLVKVVLAGRRLDRIDNIEAYTRRTLMSVFISSRRRLWRREHPHAAPPDTQAAPGGDPELGLAVRAALTRVPARQRAVLVLRYWEDLSVEETAHILGVSPGTVKSQSARGLAALRTALGDALPGAPLAATNAEEARL